MIRSEAECRAARERLESINHSLKLQRQSLMEQGITGWDLEEIMEPLRSFGLGIREDIEYYEQLKVGRIPNACRFTQVGELLISLRIAAHVSQRELASRLVVNEAQISRDERNGYHGITLERVQKVLDALGASVVILVSPQVTMSSARETVAPDNINRRTPAEVALAT